MTDLDRVRAAVTKSEAALDEFMGALTGCFEGLVGELPADGPDWYERLARLDAARVAMRREIRALADECEALRDRLAASR